MEWVTIGQITESSCMWWLMFCALHGAFIKFIVWRIRKSENSVPHSLKNVRAVWQRVEMHMNSKPIFGVYGMAQWAMGQPARCVHMSLNCAENSLQLLVRILHPMIKWSHFCWFFFLSLCGNENECFPQAKWIPLT